MAKGKPVAVYTDGGLLTVNPSDLGGTWAWVAVDKSDRIVAEDSGFVLTKNLRVSTISNIVTEHIALIKAMEFLPDGWDGKIYSDCEPTLTRVVSDYQLTRGMTRFPAAENNLPRAVSVRSKDAAVRLGKVEFILVQGHPTKKDLERGIGKKRNLPVSKFNVRADELCNREKTKYREGVACSRAINELRSIGMSESEIINLIRTQGIEVTV